MYNGKYSADNKERSVQQSQNRYYSREVVRKRRQRRQRIKLIVLIIVIAVIVVASILIFKPKKNDNASTTPDMLSGSWVYDPYTKYEFDGYGKGCMCLDDTHYEYSYQLIGDVLSMDFENEAVHDCSYTFSVVGNKLTIIGGEGTTGGTYTLNKEE